MVHQHFRNIPTLSVTENIVLGLATETLILDLDEPANRITGLSDRYSLDIDRVSPLWHLSEGEQQRVEILKPLYRNASILILDEPTSVLTLAEIEGLFSSIEKMVVEGHGVVFISHKLDEVLGICDRISIMRDGQTIATVKTASVTREDLACLMVGREVVFRVGKPD